MRGESVSFYLPEEKLVKQLNSFFSSKKSKNHELYIDKFKVLLDLKEYLDNNLLENNTIYFAHIGRKMYMIINGISCFKTLTTLVSVINYQRIQLTHFSSWGSVVVMSIGKVKRQIIFYKDMDVDVYSDNMIEKIYDNIIPKKKKRRRKK